MFPIRHSVVDNVALGREIQQRWKLPEPFACDLITRGMNDVYEVRSGKDRMAARVWRADKHTEASVTWELEFLAHLKKKGVPVIAAVPDASGNLTFAIDAPEGTRRVCLFEWAHGDQFYADPQPDIAQRIGAAVAEMHVAGADFKGRSERPIAFADHMRRKLPTLLSRLEGRADDQAFYAKAIHACADRLDEVYAAGVPVAPIHGDVHVRNVFVTPDGNFNILDFDTCGVAHLLHDCQSLAWASDYYIAHGNKTLTPAVTERFWQGYKEVRPLEPLEVECLPLFMASKEFNFMCGMSEAVNVVGHMSFGPHMFDWFARSARKNAKAAGLV